MLCYAVAPLRGMGVKRVPGAEKRGGACLSAASSQEGWTPLHFAAQEGHAAVVGHLVAAGAAVGAETRVREGGWGE